METTPVKELTWSNRETLQRMIIEKYVFAGYDCMPFVKKLKTFTKLDLIKHYQTLEKEINEKQSA